MPVYEIYVTEMNEGYVTVAAEDEESALEELYNDFDWSRIHWVNSEITDTSIELVEE